MAKKPDFENGLKNGLASGKNRFNKHQRSKSLEENK
jgi:hypothetical protein